MTDQTPPTTDIATVPIDDLIRHPDNPRQGDVGAISASIEVNGWYGTVVAQSSTGRVLAGNHRLEAARHLGMTEVPVYWVDVDDATARRIMLADNRTNDLATYDDAVLAELLTALAEDDDLLGSGYDGDDLDALLAPDGDFDYGFVPQDGMTPAERTQGWEEAGIRSLILPFTTSDYEGVVKAMADARTRLDVDNNSDALRGLLDL